MRHTIDQEQIGTPELRQYHEKTLKERFSKLTEEEAKEVMTVLQVDTISEISENIKNFKNTKVEVWQTLLYKLMSIRQVNIPLKSGEFNIYALLDVLIAALAAFAGANLAFICNEGESEYAAEPLLKDAKRDMYRMDSIKTSINDAIIYTYCKNQEHNFAFYPRCLKEKEQDEKDGITTTADHTKLPYYICPCQFVLQYRSNLLKDFDFSDDANLCEIYANCPYAKKLYDDAQIYKPSLKSDCPYLLEHPEITGLPDDPCNCVTEISVCKDDVSTDMNIELANNNIGLTDSQYVVVELDANNEHKLIVSQGQQIDVEDIIGYIKGVQVKSRLKTTVIYKTDHYFIGTLSADTSLNVENEYNKFTNEKIDEINEYFKQDSYIVRFIKDYIMYIRYPNIASHTREYNRGNDMETSFAKYEKAYKDITDQITNDYNNQVKAMSCKEFIEPYSNRGGMLDLKEYYNNMKKRNLARIIEHYKNYNNIKYCSKGRIADFVLYDYYMDYVMGDDFYYDDENPYVVKLYHYLSKYIGKRYRLEKGNGGLSGLITRFEEMCSGVVSQYLGGSSYAALKQRFGYLYYANNPYENKPDLLIKANIDDKDRVTLFSKVYKFLKTLTKYTEPVASDVEYSDNMDPLSLLNAGLSEKLDTSFGQKLKKIAMMFSLIRIAETEPLGTYSSTIGNAATVQSLFDVYQIYYHGWNIPDLIITPQTALLSSYLTTLKKMADEESRELDALVKEVLEWYYAKDDWIMSGHVYDDFKQITWPNPSKVYNLTTALDYYYIEYGLEDPENIDLTPVPNQMKYNIDNDDTTNYVNSFSGPNNYPYWLVYMGWATLANCMIPLYWSTGLIIAGSPVLLPIIFVPMYVLPGRVTVVFGLGICGICPLPLIMFVNMSNTPGTVIFPLNIVIDAIQKTLQSVLAQQSIVVTASLKPLIAACDAKINLTQKQIEDTEQEIENLKHMIHVDRKVLRALKRAAKEEHTTKEIKHEKSD